MAKTSPLTPDEATGLQLMDARRLAEVLGHSYSRICERLRSGELPGARVGNRWVVSWPEVWETLKGPRGIASQAVPAAKPVVSQPATAWQDPAAEILAGVRQRHQERVERLQARQRKPPEGEQ